MKQNRFNLLLQIAGWLCVLLIASTLIGIGYGKSIQWVASKRQAFSHIQKSYPHSTLDLSSDEAVIAFCRSKLADIGLAGIGLSADNFKPVPRSGSEPLSLVSRNEVFQNRFSVTFAEESSNENVTVTIELTKRDITCDFTGSAVTEILRRK